MFCSVDETKRRSMNQLHFFPLISYTHRRAEKQSTQVFCLCWNWNTTESVGPSRVGLHVDTYEKDFFFFIHQSVTQNYGRSGGGVGTSRFVAHPCVTYQTCRQTLVSDVFHHRIPVRTVTLTAAATALECHTETTHRPLLVTIQTWWTLWGELVFTHQEGDSSQLICWKYKRNLCGIFALGMDRNLSGL